MDPLTAHAGPSNDAKQAHVSHSPPQKAEAPLPQLDLPPISTHTRPIAVHQGQQPPDLHPLSPAPSGGSDGSPSSTGTAAAHSPHSAQPESSAAAAPLRTSLSDGLLQERRQQAADGTGRPAGTARGTASNDGSGSLMQHAGQRAKQVFDSAAQLGSSVSFKALARSPDLARQARAEMQRHSHADGMLPHDAEVERQWAVLEAVTADTLEEGRINCGQADAVLARVEASRQAAERLLGMLQALAAAEAAYAGSMAAISRITLPSEQDGAALREALGTFSDLPRVVGQGHAAVQAGMQAAARSLQELVTALRRESSELQGSSGRVARAVERARAQLQQGFVAHQVCCRAFDLVAQERRRQGAASRAFEQDPWLTEARLVDGHTALLAAQQAQRGFLAAAVQAARHLEGQRVQLVGRALEVFLQQYGPGLAAAQHSVVELGGLLQQVGGEDSLAELNKSVEAAAGTTRLLAARHVAVCEGVCQELLCSPEIIRQGEMARWLPHSQRWCESHLVLTRAGFLHWFQTAETGGHSPVDHLNLALCQFQAGEAPIFNLVELAPAKLALFPHRKRTAALKAGSVEDCCEWAIALREAISRATGKSPDRTS